MGILLVIDLKNEIIDFVKIAIPNTKEIEVTSTYFYDQNLGVDSLLCYNFF